MSALTTTGVPFDSAPTRLPVDADDVDVLLASLESELDERTPLIDVYDDYFDGRHRLTFVSARFREVFAQMLAAVADNWCPVVVRASVERLHVQGFRMTEQADSDSAAWEIWQRNELDEGADLAFTEAVKHGESYLLVWWDDLNPERARITVEHPLQVIVRRVPGDRTRLRAALKRWWDPDFEAWFATLWTPDTVYRRWRGPKDAWWSPYGDAAAEPNPLQTVPVVPLVNDPHMLPSRPPGALLAVPHRIPESSIVGLGRSDLADVVSTQDQVNKLVCDMMVASELGAFRQRWATGLEVPRDPETGDPIEPFRSAVNRLWIAENADSRFGDFAATDLDNYIKAITSRIQSLASRSRVPWHYLLAGMGAVPSGESLRAAETGLVAKVADKQRSFESPLERAMRLAFQVEGDVDRARAWKAEVDWAQSESRTESQYVDALVKKLSIGVPIRQLWEDYGYSPQQIERFRGMLLEQAMESGLLAGVPAPGAPNPPLAPSLPADQTLAGGEDVPNA